ncbi:MAG TPA: hypothetical protein VM715_12160, partial [Candidatus Acidoferrum sp.]|nr:hypothetical protein [Candidatus Acidoferrum sp.]
MNKVRSRAGALFTPAGALAYDLTVFTARRQHDLPVERVRSRVGAYIYGNILVLAAIFAPVITKLMNIYPTAATIPYSPDKV